ncbi:MAG: hypothetical protein KatS3mg031_0233 [Chitinophagales bacterium]|nr:MAG: hypothetical protein KatS3mg031_0233 [Chitinophagales bacterium]
MFPRPPSDSHFPRFRLIGKKQRISSRKLLMLLVAGYLVILGLVMGIRCTFLIGAVFTEGVVTGLQYGRNIRARDIHPVVTFTAQDRTYTFTGAANVPLSKGQKVRVAYKKHNPSRAVIYTFWGFWFNALLTAQVLLLFWVGLLIVYYGYYR